MERPQFKIKAEVDAYECEEIGSNLESISRLFDDVLENIQKVALELPEQADTSLRHDLENEVSKANFLQLQLINQYQRLDGLTTKAIKK